MDFFLLFIYTSVEIKNIGDEFTNARISMWEFIDRYKLRHTL